MVRMIQRKKKTLYDNKDYFKWFENNKDKIKIISIKTLENKIKIEYEIIKNKDIIGSQKDVKSIDKTIGN